MKPRPILCLASVMLLTCLLPGADWWETKPYTEWSKRDTDRLLNKSPWVALSNGGLLFNELGRADDLRPASWSFRVRLLSSKVIRKALLRRISLSSPTFSGTQIEKVVSIADLEAEKGAGRARARLEKFIYSNPNGLLVSGDDRFIVVAVSFARLLVRTAMSTEDSDRARAQGSRTNTDLPPEPYSSAWIEDSKAELFAKLPPEHYFQTTFLSTKSGKRIGLTRYAPPGSDGLGALFYFPRFLHDGTLAVNPEDAELLFEAFISGRAVKAKFDLRKMIYQGKFEI